MEKKDLEMPTWSNEDFVCEKIKKSEWETYKKKYPNLSWGTCIIGNSGEEYTVQRFVSKKKCLFYCNYLF